MARFNDDYEVSKLPYDKIAELAEEQAQEHDFKRIAEEAITEYTETSSLDEITDSQRQDVIDWLFDMHKDGYTFENNVVVPLADEALRSFAENNIADYGKGGLLYNSTNELFYEADNAHSLPHIFRDVFGEKMREALHELGFHKQFEYVYDAPSELYEQYASEEVKSCNFEGIAKEAIDEYLEGELQSEDTEDMSEAEILARKRELICGWAFDTSPGSFDDEITFKMLPDLYDGFGEKYLESYTLYEDMDGSDWDYRSSSKLLDACMSALMTGMEEAFHKLGYQYGSGDDYTVPDDEDEDYEPEM